MKHLFSFVFLIFSLTASADAHFDRFLKNTDDLLSKHVVGDKLDYTNIKRDKSLSDLIEQIANQDLSTLTDLQRKAFLINAYNMLVINQAVSQFPLSSVQSKAGFFDRKSHNVGGKNYSLNQIEKDLLLKKYKDARLHFVLVCGALGCPPITNSAYFPEYLEDDLDRQTTSALNDPNFISVKEGKLMLSQIFQWYQRDFGGKNNIIPFINKYRSQKIASDISIGYYDYDWGINDISASSTGSQTSSAGAGANAFRYVVSAAIPKGGIEIKLFNNLYSQRTGDGATLTNRSSFFTTTLSALYGYSSRFNLGFETRYRRLKNSSLPSSPFDVFKGGPQFTNRSGVTAIGPKIRFAPFKQLKNFSIQSTLTFPIGDDLEGNAVHPFIDWTGATFNTQLFNDFSIGSNFSLFTELDFLLEDIGSNNLNRFSTPVTGILSYFPNKKTTVYVLSSFSPYWQSDFDYFAQAGLGAKYQFTPSFELELLVTKFTNEFLNSNNGDAATYNIGFRYSY